MILGHWLLKFSYFILHIRIQFILHITNISRFHLSTRRVELFLLFYYFFDTHSLLLYYYCTTTGASVLRYQIPLQPLYGDFAGGFMTTDLGSVAATRRRRHYGTELLTHIPLDLHIYIYIYMVYILHIISYGRDRGTDLREFRIT